MPRPENFKASDHRAFPYFSGQEVIMYQIFHILTRNPNHSWSDVNPNILHQNPPKRLALHRATLAGFKDLANLMIASKQVFNIITDLKTTHRQNLYPYEQYREALITKTCIQSYYRLSKLKHIPSPLYISPLIPNYTNNHSICELDPTQTNSTEDRLPRWLMKRWINLRLQGKHLLL